MIKIIKEDISVSGDTRVGSYSRFAISDSQLQQLYDKHNLNEELIQEVTMLTGLKDITNLSREEKVF